MSQITHWQTYKKFRTFWKKWTNIPGMSPKKFRKIFYSELEIFQYLCNFSKKVSQIAEWQTYKKIRIVWNKCTNIQVMSPKNFRKISYLELKISLYYHNFSKEVSQLTNRQTYKRFWTIWKKSRYILGMPPKKFRMIYHPELDIYRYWYNFIKEVG